MKTGYRLFRLRWGLYVLACLLVGCTSGSDTQNPNTLNSGPALFTSLSPEQTGVTFANNLTEGPNTNVLMYEYFYNGGGVAVGDLNNDGLDDIYFSGNMVPNQLYINKGKMAFADVTDAAGVAGRPGPWKTGVAMADVNGDGRLDLFLSYSGSLPPQKRTPQLLINDGADAQGVPHFSDQTAKFGLDKPFQTTQVAFFDYDRDGDLDLFILNHNPRLLPILEAEATKSLLGKTNPEIGVKLFQNTNNHFSDITEKAGLSSSELTYGLGIGIADLNADGWPDLYVSNDYGVPDYLYLNNHNGTFQNVIQRSMGHTSNFSMGNDVADVNNDGRPDILSLDMLPEDNRRQKLLLAPDNYDKYALAVSSGFHHQLMRNMLQLNVGNAGTVPQFSEIGQLAGISNTDWSWSPLLADYDNDGWKDLYVTNGYVRDYTNQDFLKYMTDFMQNRPTRPTREDVLELVHKMPSSNVANYMFRNTGAAGGEVRYDDAGKRWGLTQTANSTGAAYADLDNDGDLDLVVNNTNQPAFIFQNQANRALKHHYLSVKLEGSAPNTQGLGAKLMLYQNGHVQYLEQMPTRGYQSSVSPRLHFGLGTNAAIDSLRIIWLSGKSQLIKTPKTNQLLTLKETEADGKTRTPASGSTEPTLFREIKTPIAFTDAANPLNDFKRQPLLVNAQSFNTPCMAKADVNADGREDLYVGGTRGQAGAVFLQNPNGQFSRVAQPAFEADKASASTAAAFFDANADGKPDLYVCSGGYDDFEPNDPRLQDRLYLNDGSGHFTKAADALPAMPASTATVCVIDANADGKPDLFVGGRVVPGRYPETPRSYVLVNDGSGHFTDQTPTVAPDLQRIGMVTAAVWTDLNADTKPELVVVGEWMPIRVFGVSGGKLTDQTQTFLPKSYSGWWNTVLAEDLNADGKPDLVLGNQGLNTQCRASEQQPAELVYKDFDNNGKIDPVLCLYVQGKSYPHPTRDELLDQLPMLRPRFTTYDSYANATLTDIFKPDERSDAKTLTANTLQTTLLLSTPSGKLAESPLPLAAQVAPVFTITALDYDHDGRKDLLLCGNTYQARLRFGRSDANRGVLLHGDGKGHFSTVPNSGFNLSGDVRSVMTVNNLLLVGINQQPIRAYTSR